MSFGELPAGVALVAEADPIVEARVETLREVKQLLGEWELDRHPVTRGMLLAKLESLRLLVVVEA